MAEIQFYHEDVDHPLEQNQIDKIKLWVKETILQESDSKPGDLSVIFCSDAYLLDINIRYLDHDYFTDIITFEYQSSPLTADLYISTERVRENAKEMNHRFFEELCRVIIHGVLHLCGYDDKSVEEEKLMRSRENHYLQALFNEYN